MQCPLQAKFKTIDLLPSGPQSAKASFGTILHKCLEGYNKTGDLAKAQETFRDLWHNPEKLGVTPEVWPRGTTFGGLKGKGLQILESFHNLQKWDNRVVIATEHEFLVPFGKYDLHGFVDLLEGRRSGKGKEILRVIDYKTNTRAPNMAELALDIQFTIYDIASRKPEFWLGNGPEFPAMENGAWYYEQYRDMPRRNIWYHLWGPKEIDAGSRDEEDFERLYRLCEQVERAIELEVFVPKIGDPCLWCPYHEPCGLKVPTQEELFDQENAWL